MARHARQPAQLVGAETENIVQAGIGAIELEDCVQLALAAQDAGAQLVGQTPVALRQTLEVAVACIGQRFA